MAAFSHGIDNLVRDICRVKALGQIHRIPQHTSHNKVESHANPAGVVCVCVCLSVCACLCAHLSLCLSLPLSVSLCVCPSVFSSEETKSPLPTHFETVDRRCSRGTNAKTASTSSCGIQAKLTSSSSSSSSSSPPLFLLCSITAVLSSSIFLFIVVCCLPLCFLVTVLVVGSCLWREIPKSGKTKLARKKLARRHCSLCSLFQLAALSCAKRARMLRQQQQQQQQRQEKDDNPTSSKSAVGGGEDDSGMPMIDSSLAGESSSTRFFFFFFFSPSNLQRNKSKQKSKETERQRDRETGTLTLAKCLFPA